MNHKDTGGCTDGLSVLARKVLLRDVNQEEMDELIAQLARGRFEPCNLNGVPRNQIPDDVAGTANLMARHPHLGEEGALALIEANLELEVQLKGAYAIAYELVKTSDRYKNGEWPPSCSDITGLTLHEFVRDNENWH